MVIDFFFIKKKPLHISHIRFFLVFLQKKIEKFYFWTCFFLIFPKKLLQKNQKKQKKTKKKSYKILLLNKITSRQLPFYFIGRYTWGL